MQKLVENKRNVTKAIDKKIRKSRKKKKKKKKNPCGLNFTKKVSRKCPFYNYNPLIFHPHSFLN